MSLGGERGGDREVTSVPPRYQDSHTVVSLGLLTMPRQNSVINPKPNPISSVWLKVACFWRKLAIWYVDRRDL